MVFNYHRDGGVVIGFTEGLGLSFTVV